MADEPEAAPDTAPDSESAASPPAKAGRNSKKLAIIGAGAAVLLLSGGGGAYMMLASKSASADAHEEAPESEKAPAGGKHGGAAKDNAPIDVPPILVNLRSPDGAAHFLKVHFMLVAGSKSDAEELQKDMPLLIDAYQPFLRELRPEDLSGSAAVFRIKEELLVRAGTTLGADHVKDVLMQDLIQQ